MIFNGVSCTKCTVKELYEEYKAKDDLHSIERLFHHMEFQNEADLLAFCSADQDVTILSAQSLQSEPRHCEKCNSQFTPKSKKARFCSTKCRVSYHRSN